MLTRVRAVITAFVLLIGLLAGGSLPADADAVTIRLQPEYTVAEVGDTVFVMVVVDGVVDLGAFEFHLGFDPAVLEAPGAQLDAFLTGTGRSPVPLGPLIREDEIRFAAASYGSENGPEGTGVLARVAFRVVGPGTSALTFNRVIVTDTSAHVMPATAIHGTFSTGETPYPPIFLPLVIE